MENGSESLEDLVKKTRESFQLGKYMAEGAREKLATVISDEAQKKLNQKKSAKGNLEYLLAELEVAKVENDETRIAQLESFIKITRDNISKFSKPSSEKDEVRG